MKLALIFSVVSQLCSLGLSTTAPAGCRLLPTDEDWPAQEVWEASLPGVIKTKGSDANGPLPDYRLRVQNNSDVQAAMKFAAKYNIRLSVIATGHDQLGRSTAGSGLLIDLSLLAGVRLSESYTPTITGLEDLDHRAAPNVINPIPGVQAAVTYGPAVAGLALNYAVAPSNLFTLTGAAGMYVATWFGI